jgi:hypothetical protein
MFTVRTSPSRVSAASPTAPAVKKLAVVVPQPPLLPLRRSGG